MGVQTSVQRLKDNVSAALARIAEKGIAVPPDANSDDLESLIASIEVGGSRTVIMRTWTAADVQ